MATTDYDTMRLAELAAISDLLHELENWEWDHATLCTGWRVRDVVGHMCVGYTTGFPTMLAKIGRRGFNVPKASFEESKRYGSNHAPAEILAVFDRIRRERIRKGVTKVIPAKEALVDHLIHHQDIRRPLDRPRILPEDRLVAALDVVPGLGGFVGAEKRVAGLRLVATDVGWRHGDGPTVEGPGEALLLASSGRPAGLTGLRGDGLATLRERVAA